MKKILKKSLACMLAAILCLTACVGAMATVGAEGAITYAIADVTVNQGEKTVIDVAISNFADVAGLIAEITLPDAVVSIDGVKLNDTAELVKMTNETAGHYVLNGKTIKFVGLFNSLDEFKLGNVNALTINIAVTVADAASETTFAAPVFQAGTANEEILDVNGTAGKLTVKAVCKHAETEIVEENRNEADCVNPGSYDEVVKCKACGVEISRTNKTIEAKGHTDETIPAVAPTCTATGLTAGVKCSVCDTVITAPETVDALGHDWNEGEVTTAPDCENAGVKTYTCANDPSHTKEEAIDALGHKVVDVDAVAPTCTETGLTAGKKCSVCGAFTVPQETVDALGHDFGDNLEYCANECGTANPNYVPPVVGPEVNNSIIPDLKIVISDTLGLGVFVTTAQLKDYDYYEIEVIQTKYDDDCNYKTAAAAVLRNTELSNGGTGKLYGRFMGVQMHGLALNMQVVIKCYKNDQLVAVSNAFNTSMAELAIAQFDSTSKATTKTLMSDLLVMGAEAEKYFAGRYPNSKLAEVVEEGNLCNKGFVGTPTETVGELNTVEITEDGESDITNTLTLGVALSGAPAVSYLFQNKGLDKSKLVMELSYDCIYNNTGEITDTVTGDMWKTNGNYFTYNFTKTRMYDSNKTVTAKIYYDGKLVLTNQYSVETYVATRKTSSSAYNLCNAIAKFGAAARAYFPGS